MSKNERLRDKYPIFYAYEGRHEFLGADDAAGKTLDERIKSVWPFIISCVRSFEKTLSVRERANYDMEDVVSEIWLALAEKDDKWTPERGKYITFAGVVIHRELSAIRDKCRTVHGPRNSSCMMKKYSMGEDDGTITPRKAKTAADIRRTIKGATCVTENPPTKGCNSPEPSAVVGRAESAAENLDAVKLSIRKNLTPFEAKVMGLLCGLWGNPSLSVFWIAWHEKKDPSEVRRAKDRAVSKIRKHLASIKHPALKNRD